MHGLSKGLFNLVMANIQSSLKKSQPDSAPSDNEKYWLKHETWNQPDISQRALLINNEQMLKLSPKAYETIVEVGNTIYPKRKHK